MFSKHRFYQNFGSSVLGSYSNIFRIRVHHETSKNELFSWINFQRENSRAGKKLKGVKNLRREESSHDIHKTRKFTRIKTKAAAKSSEE